MSYKLVWMSCKFVSGRFFGVDNPKEVVRSCGLHMNCMLDKIYPLLTYDNEKKVHHHHQSRTDEDDTSAKHEIDLDDKRLHRWNPKSVDNFT